MTKRLRILMSGGTGFIGRNLIPLMGAADHQIELLSRQQRTPPDGVECVHAVGDLGAETVPEEPFTDVDVLVHMAGHVMVRGEGPIEDSDNVRMARIIAKRAQTAEIPKVLVLSSIAASVAAHQPELARRYGHEKLAADAVFADILSPEQCCLFVRPPAVYGPGMSGPLATLAGLVRRGIPLPFRWADAPRNYISNRNLCALLDRMIGATDAEWIGAHGKVFAPSDGPPVTTAELVRMMAASMGCSARLVPFPIGLLRIAGRAAGRAEMVSGAIDQLTLADNKPIEDHFGWTPGKTMPESLAFLASSTAEGAR